MDILVLLLSQMPFSSENIVTGKGQKRGSTEQSCSTESNYAYYSFYSQLRMT